MPVYLPTAIIGNATTLVTLGHSGEIMGWFYPAKDHAQNIYQCMPCVYRGQPGRGSLHWSWGGEWQRHQSYDGDSNVCRSTLRSDELGLQLEFTDVVPEGLSCVLRRLQVTNLGAHQSQGRVFLYGDFNMGGIRTGNALRFDAERRLLLQSHRDVALAIGGDALETWQCGKAGEGWGSNARHDLSDGWLQQQDLEIGDVNWAFGFDFDLAPQAMLIRHATLALAGGAEAAMAMMGEVSAVPFEEHVKARAEADKQWLVPGLSALHGAGGDALPEHLTAAYKRSLLALPLLCGPEGVALAAPEFDPEFVACGGYGYLWPRDGGEYVSGLQDAGYPQFSRGFFDWCARHQDASGLWHQRYFLNGEPGPNWCLPPDMLQIDQVGAVLWAYGKWRRDAPGETSPDHAGMIRKAADYLLSRLTDRGVHGNAFDTWETFIGSFTYSNAAIYAAFRTAAEVLGDERYAEGAQRVKQGVLRHFVRHDGGYPYLVRGFNGVGDQDPVVDSASLGAIEPFALLDLNNPDELALAEGLLRAITEKLETDWEGGRAIRRFEWDAYVGGVPACVNTLWMARCCLTVGARLRQIGRSADAEGLAARAELYLSTVLHRATPTGLLPELMQGPEGQRYWAAPHGWAMASFVSGVLMLARDRGDQHSYRSI